MYFYKTLFHSEMTSRYEPEQYPTKNRFLTFGAVRQQNFDSSFKFQTPSKLSDTSATVVPRSMFEFQTLTLLRGSGVGGANPQNKELLN